MRYLAAKEYDNDIWEAVDNIFGYENPFKRSMIVWVIRDGYKFDNIQTDDDRWVVGIGF